MEQGEDVVRHAAGICVMHERVEAGRVGQEAIKQERGFARRRQWLLEPVAHLLATPNDAGMERSVLARQKGVDFQAGIRTVLRVDEPAAAIGSKELAIR